MIDLHMHSCYSDDGEFTPDHLARLCSTRNITHMSVTDHNCIKADSEARIAAAARGIHYISGIEIDCVYRDRNFHMLGYGIDSDSDDFLMIENHVRSQSRKASKEMLNKTIELGFRITEDDMHNLAKDTYWPEAWTGEMFAEILLAKADYRNHPLLLPYRPGGLRSDNPYVNFYWDFYSQGKPCFVPMNYPRMAEIINLIHKNHGLAVLAHPGINLNGQHDLLDGIITLGIDGIEAFSSYHRPDQAAVFYDKAAQHGLAVTCGSDFHGKTKPSIGIGGHGCTIADQEILRLLDLIII